MKQNNIFFTLILTMFVGANFIFAQETNRLYLSVAERGAVYDITGLPAALPTAFAAPNYTADAAGSEPRTRVSNLAVGFDAGGNDPNNIAFIHSNTASAALLYKTKNGSTTPTGGSNVSGTVITGGIGMNNVPQANGIPSGVTFGFSNASKNLYRVYPNPADLGTVTGDAIWNNTDSRIWATDTFFDYTNNIYVLVQNSINSVFTRYLYRVNTTTLVATRVRTITGPVGNYNATASVSSGGASGTVGNVRGLAYLNNTIYAVSVNGETELNVFEINMNTGVSVLQRTYTGFTGMIASNQDLASVPYYIPFTFDCGKIAFQGTASFVKGTASTRTLRVPIANVYETGSFTVNTSGTNFTSVANTVSVSSAAPVTQFVDVNVTYDGSGNSGFRTITVDLNGSTTKCLVSVFIDEDSDVDGVLNTIDLDDDNDGITNSIEGKCATVSNAGTDGFDNPIVSTVNGNNIQATNPYNGWIAQTPAGTPATAFNIVRVDGTGYADGPDNAHSGTQYVDINGAGGTIYRDFTFATPTVVSASAFFSNRATNTAGYVGWNTRIEIFNVGTNQVVFSGNDISFNKSMGDENWFQSFISNQPLPAGTYRIRMNVSDFGHVDTISYCFSTDTDGDGIPNHLDADSDGDGCADALEGSETVRYNQIYPLTFATPSLRGQIKVLGNGTTVGTPSQIVSTVTAANGVPLLVNNAANNTGGVAGVADNTDGTADVGQGLGTSQNSGLRDVECDRCFRPATSPGVGGLATNHGITALGRAGVENGNWPMKITGAYTALDAKTKGFVVNRLPFTGTPSVPTGIAPANFVQGMMVYDTTNNCLKIYDGTQWYCYTKQTCDDFTQ